MNLNVSTGDSPLGVMAREELERILDEDNAKLPPRRKKMLRYIVEETLAGRGSKLNAVPIAQSVFNRGERFDHQSDPVVRIEAHRLRRDLETYYANSGRNNPLRITIPKGHYIAHFEFADGSNGDPLPEQRKQATAGNFARSVGQKLFRPALFAALLITLGGAYHWLHSDKAVSSRPVGPGVLVMPFKTIEGDFNAELADGITHEIVTALLRFPNIRVLAPKRTPEITGSISEENGADVSYLLEGKIKSNSSNIQVQAKLIRVDNRNVIWSKSYTRTSNAGNLMAMEAELASHIASELGQTYGVINTDLIAHIDQFEPKLSSYYCILLTYHHRRNPPGDASFPHVQDCLEKTVNDEPDYAEAWALLARNYNDAIRFQRVPASEVTRTRAKAFDAASRALALDPQNSNALVALSAIHFYNREYQLSEKYGRLAVQSNPNDPTNLILLSSRLILRGKFAEGTPLLERGIAQSIEPPGFSYQLLFIDRLMNGDKQEMLDLAQRGTVDGSALSYSLVAMARGMLGDSDGATAALDRMNEISPGYDPIARMKVHQASDEIVDAMTQALHLAGWQRVDQARLN